MDALSEPDSAGRIHNFSKAFTDPGPSPQCVHVYSDSPTLFYSILYLSVTVVCKTQNPDKMDVARVPTWEVYDYSIALFRVGGFL